MFLPLSSRREERTYYILLGCSFISLILKISPEFDISANLASEFPNSQNQTWVVLNQTGKQNYKRKF